ncbi:MAG TPA: bifunctional phosphopantothenoylcysteine decarboxylase/phosphopantothenate--cysteine ligase CoaBC [Nitrososphaeraceae archaeon]|nr:bifunctional phosphopantothenoylcysteine decarboxylase/phosphopantothenate--cysteine ligase CoaBC [Nitrososphaeraceae archaeon]
MKYKEKSGDDSIRRERHPSKDITAIEGNEIEGKKIVLCITGSIAAYKAIDLSRMLMRHGADVHCVMSENAASALLTADMMKWATGNNVVTRLTGDLEHIFLADYNMSDLIIVYPCTANTLGKISNGIDDTPVTSVLSVALGSRIPIIIAPAMHKSMYENPFIKENICRLMDQGIEFLQPLLSEGKAKVAHPEQALKRVLNKFDKHSKNGVLSLHNKNILVTAGSTVEYIDPVRVITNLSSGKIGNAIAKEVSNRGAKVTIVYGYTTVPSYSESSDFKIIKATTTEEMYNTVVSELSSKTYDVAILAAAVTDFRPEEKKSNKIDSRINQLSLSLIPTKKIINQIKHITKNDTFVVAFKAEYNISDLSIVEKAYQKLKECNCDLIVANDIGREGSEAGSDNDEVFIVNIQKKVIHLPLQSKRDIAKKLVDIITESIEAKNNGLTLGKP